MSQTKVTIEVNVPEFVAEHIKGKTLSVGQLDGLRMYFQYRDNNYRTEPSVHHKIEGYLDVCVYDNVAVYGLTDKLEFFDDMIRDRPDIAKQIQFNSHS